MTCNLYINTYFEKNEARRRELEVCYQNNLEAGFNEIWLIVEQKDEEYALDLLKQYNEGNSTIHIKIVNERPDFQYYIDKANSYNLNTLHVVMNNDIYIKSNELEKLKLLPWSQKLFVGLSRWDIGPEGSFLLDRPDSQDSYIWFEKCEITRALCPIGNPGSDNHILYKFQAAGYKVVNPSKSIVTLHLHNVKINNYRDSNGNVKSTQICPEPYYFAKPIFISEI